MPAERPSAIRFFADDAPDVLTAARLRVAASFDQADHIAVLFSGGKDSTVVLNLAVEEAERRGWHEPVRVIHWDEEAVSMQTHHYIERVIADHGARITFEWWCVPISHRNATTKQAGEGTWYPWDPACPERWCRPMPAAALTQDDFPAFPRDVSKRWTHAEALAHLPTHQTGVTHMLFGIRSQESIVRTTAILSRRDRPEPWISMPSKGRPGTLMFKAYPIYDWTEQDVWRAPGALGWDYNRSYDVMEMLGIKRADQRVSPPFGEQPMLNLHMWADGFPELWEKMLDRVPGARTAARYARTELYGIGAIEKPDELSWPEYINGLANQHDAVIAGKTLYRVSQLLAKHAHNTSDPVLPRAPHPVTGLSWRFLAKVALRSDTKGRAVSPRGDAVTRERWARQWAAEKAEIDAQGGRYDH